MNSELLAIETVGVHKEFREFRALADVCLSVPQGQLVVVLGPSGCGKSTLLKLVAGLESSSCGEVRVLGKRVSPRSPDQQNVGMVFQDSALYPHFTVRKNLQFAVRPQKLGRKEVDARVSEVASQLEIACLMDRYPADLSGGERQRVAIGRAIIRKPKILLLDEPLSQLDANLRVQLRSLLVDMHQQLSATTVYVTHDANEAMELADRVVVMQRGKIVQDDTPETIYENPVSQWVASFVGDPPINFVQGSLVGKMLLVGDQQLLMSNLVIENTDLSKFMNSAADKSIEEDPISVQIGFRPQSLRFEKQPCSEQLAFQAVLQRMYRREDRVICELRSQLGQHRLISEVKPDLSVGSVVQVSVAANNLMFFDAKTGVRIC